MRSPNATADRFLTGLLCVLDLCRLGDYTDVVVGVGAEGLVRAGFAGWCRAVVSA